MGRNGHFFETTREGDNSRVCDGLPLGIELYDARVLRLREKLQKGKYIGIGDAPSFKSGVIDKLSRLSILGME